MQELLGGLSADELAAVELMAEVLHTPAGEVVFREGDHADAIYFVLSGQVPFPGGTATEKLLRHQLEEPASLERLRPDLAER